jgi:hypothetical protein
LSTSATGPIPTTGTTLASPTSVPSAPASSTSGAKIAGAVVGPVCAVALILGLAYMFFRRKRNVSATEIAPQCAQPKVGLAESRPVLQSPGSDMPGNVTYYRMSVPLRTPARRYPHRLWLRVRRTITSKVRFGKWKARLRCGAYSASVP